MSHNDTNTQTEVPAQIVAANAARVRVLAEAAARNPDKLRRAIRVVRAALDQELIDLEDLVAS